MNRPPLKVNQQFYSLVGQGGVSPAAISFNSVALESDRCVSVCETGAEDAGQLVTVDLRSFEVTKRNNKAEAVLPHPTRNWTAVRARSPDNDEHTTVIVYNMESKEKLLLSTVPEPVKFWTWVDDRLLGLVGSRAVYHLSAEGLSGSDNKVSAERVYDREGAFAPGNQVQIIDHDYLPARKFGYLCGLSKKSEGGAAIVGGDIQLTSTALGKSQFFEGYTACFGRLQTNDEGAEIDVFAYCEKAKLGGKVTVSEIGAAAGAQKFKQVVEMSYPEGHETDFPLFMSVDGQLGLLFLLTKMGLLFVFEVSEGALLLRSRVSETQLIMGCATLALHGCLVLSKAGNLLSITVDEQPFVDFVRNAAHIKNNTVVAQKLALRAGLPGSEAFYIERFNALFSAGDFEAAAKAVARSPGSILRNRETIDRFRALSAPEQGPHPLLRYFTSLLEAGTLNAVESVELSQLVVQQKRVQMIARWLDEGKLTLTEQLGDLLRPYDAGLAERVYAGCGSAKLLPMRLQRGGKELDATVSVAAPEALLAQFRGLCLSDPAAALGLARSAVRLGRLSPHTVAEGLLSVGLHTELTTFCLECLPDAPEHGQWQTTVLELNLKKGPSLAETLFQTAKWSFFDRRKIGLLCEQSGLPLRALENLSDVADVSRVLRNHAAAIPPEFLKKLVAGPLPAEHVPAVLTEMMRSTRNTRAAVEVAQAAVPRVGAKELARVFEAAGLWEGVYLLLQPVLPASQDRDLHHKFIEACARSGQMGEVERVLQTAEGSYAPEKVLEMLLSVKLADAKALIVLCDKHNFIKQMVRYLCENSLTQYIDTYVVLINPQRAGEVFGALLDYGVEESYLRQLLATLGAGCAVASVVREFEQRSRLRVLEDWLEQRAAEGNTLEALHNARAKLALDFGRGAERFLRENRFYNAKAIGAYAESIDPSLAFLAYTHEPGSCDAEVLSLTTRNAMFRLQAEYVISRQSRELWEQVLAANEPHRTELVDQMVTVVLPESRSVEEVSVAVHAFLRAGLSEALINLLEKLVFHSAAFSNIPKLQNLLISTAMRVAKPRVMDYLSRMQQYDGEEVARAAMQPDCAMYEEAFFVYKRLEKPVEAVRVLLERLEDVDRAASFAEKANLPAVWQALGRAHLRRGDLERAVDALVRARDASAAEEIIELGREQQQFEKLLQYLEMARQTRKEAALDEEFVYCLARLDRLAQLEAFLGGPNAAESSQLGERLFAEQLWNAARTLFAHVKNNARVASCLLQLGQFPAAVEFARKANNARTWKEVAFACVRAGEFKLAAAAAAAVALLPDHLEELTQFYELHDAAEELIAVLEAGINNEKAHVGIFTELAAMYARHSPAKLFTFIKAYFAKLNVTKLTRICRKQQLWSEVVYLHAHYKEPDNAIRAMMEHSPACFAHDDFVLNLMRVSNSDLIYQAISFYVEEEPLRLNDLLKEITPRLDLARVVAQLRRRDCLPLALDWLRSVQGQNIQAVNDALNAIYLELEDFEALRRSVQNHDAFDAIGLARQVEHSARPEMRRVAGLIYRRNKKFAESVELSLCDGRFLDAIEAAQESRQSELAESLLRGFAERGLREHFAVTTYTCNELIAADLVVELAWRFGLNDFAMPFFVQMTHDLTQRSQTFTKRVEELEKKEEAKQEREAKKPLATFMGGLAAPSLLSAGLPMLMGGQATNFGAMSGTSPRLGANPFPN